MKPTDTLYLAVVLSAFACGTDEPSVPDGPGMGPPGTPSFAMLESSVQPMFDRLCAQTACHGDPERPLFLYSSFGTRLGSPLMPLTAEELQANLASARTFIEGLDDVTESELLSRPLRRAAGGTSHGGGEQFYDRADAGYVLLSCWLLGGTYAGLECVR